MRKVVLHVRRVDQRNQHIDIQQIARQRSSSRSWRTSSEVTLGLLGLTRSKGTPFLVLPLGSAGRKAWRASDETTSPKLFRCIAASSFAAANTSSSIASVVRI
jgi:hypothetical protein